MNKLISKKGCKLKAWNVTKKELLYEFFPETFHKYLWYVYVY